jgi:spore coat protein U-like protein
MVKNTRVVPQFNSKRMLIAGSILFAAVSMPATASAQISGTLNASLNLTSACSVNGEIPAGPVDLGDLDFGTHSAVFTGELTAQARVAGERTKIRCSGDIGSVSIEINAGLNAGGTPAFGDGTRALKHETENVYVRYELYADPTHTTVYMAGVAQPVALTPGEELELPIYGRINKSSPEGLQPGTYRDTVTVTITF